MRPKNYNNRSPKLLQRYWRHLTLFIVVGMAGAYFIFSSFAATTNITIDFNTVTQKLAYKPFSGTISTYGDQYDINRSAAQRTALTNLKLGMYRVPIRWNNGNPVSSAGGHPSGSGDAWISNIKAIGSEPMVVLGGDTDNNFSPQDGANLVRYFNQTKNYKIKYWMIGNEPNNGNQMSLDAYCNLFNNTANAMKAVDPTVKIGGPTWSFFSPDVLRQFLNCAKNTVDVVVYHEYPNSDTGSSNERLLADTHMQADRIREARNIVNQVIPARSAQIEIQVGELNWSWHKNDNRTYQTVATVWSAADFGGIVVAGGRAHQYSDLNGALGLTYDHAANGNQPITPMPIYYGLFMFTGGNLFRGFGDSAVKSSTVLPNVEVFASTNQKSIVAVNKDPNAGKLGSIQMTGVTDGTKVDVWQTDKNAPAAAPKKKATLTVAGGKVEHDLAAYSVTTFVVGADPVVPDPPDPDPPNPGTFIAEDINQDGKVNLTDLSTLLTKFNQSGAGIGRADINGSGKVDIQDLSRLLTKFQR